MRVALISDIHGNLVSLEAVLADIDRAQVGQIVCLGDVAALGPQPREVVARLNALGCPCVMGNHDQHLLDPASAGELEPWLAEVMAWCATQLSEADLAYLRSFRPWIEIPLDAQTTLFCYHGSPASNEERILSTTPPADLERMLAGRAAAVMAGGHNHVQMLRRHRDTLIVDVGSVGQPFERMPFAGVPRFLPWAEYAIVGRSPGVLSVDLRQVSVDVDAVKQAALDSDMPGKEGWVSWWKMPGTRP
jgi:predicted phosphodiesterase